MRSAKDADLHYSMKRRDIRIPWRPSLRTQSGCTVVLRLKAWAEENQASWPGNQHNECQRRRATASAAVCGCSFSEELIDSIVWRNIIVEWNY